MKLSPSYKPFDWIFSILLCSSLSAQVPVGTVSGSGQILRNASTIPITGPQPVYAGDVITSISGKAPVARFFDTKATLLAREASGGYRIVQVLPEEGWEIARLVSRSVVKYDRLPRAVRAIGRDGKPVRKGKGDQEPVYPNPAAGSSLIPGEIVQFRGSGTHTSLVLKTAAGETVTAIPWEGQAETINRKPDDINLTPGHKYTWTAEGSTIKELAVTVVSEDLKAEIEKGMAYIEKIYKEPGQQNLLKACFLDAFYREKTAKDTHLDLDLEWLAYQYAFDSHIDHQLVNDIISDYRNRKDKPVPVVVEGK